MKKLLSIIVLAVTLAIAGCQGNNPVTCMACGNGGIICDGPIQDCIGDSQCDTGGPGGLVLDSNGTFLEPQTGQTGTYTISGNAISLKPDGGNGVIALVSIDSSEAQCSAN